LVVAAIVKGRRRVCRSDGCARGENQGPIPREHGCAEAVTTGFRRMPDGVTWNIGDLEFGWVSYDERGKDDFDTV